MNKRATFHPVLLELIVSILFFALAMSVVVRLLAAADETSRMSELTGRALIAMESVAEEWKADPAGGDFDENGERRFTARADGDIELSVLVRREAGGAGALYTIEIRAESGGTPLGAISTARYVSGEVGA